MLDYSLEQFGLNPTEVKVYLALLPLGTVPASTLGRRLQIPRSTAKYTCEQLAQKGLIISSNKNNTTLYAARNPSHLQNLIEKQREQLEEKQSQLNEVVNELTGLFQQSEVLPKVSYFEGADNVIRMFEDVLKENKTLYGALYINDEVDTRILHYIEKVYIPARIKMGFQSWMIFNDDERTQKYETDHEEMNRVILYVPKDEFPFEICFHIYGEKIAFYYSTKNMSMGVIIEDARIQKMHFSLFKMAWNYALTLPANKSFKSLKLK